MEEGTRSQSQPCDVREPISRTVIDAEPSAAVIYREWTISYDPPPIPIRNYDWHFEHPNLDASYEGPEDGWISNGLWGYAASLEDAKAEIDEIEAARG